MKKKKFIGLLIGLCLVILILGSISKSPAELTGRHELQHMIQHRSLEGEFKGEGSYFLFVGGGSIQGKLSNYSSLQFCWLSKPNQMIISEVPLSKIRFIFTDIKNPTIEFKFDNPFWARGENLNKYIESNDLNVATIRISKGQFDKEFVSD